MSDRDQPSPSSTDTIIEPVVDDDARARGRSVLVEVGREVTAAIKANDPRVALLLAEEVELALEIKRRFGY